MKKITIVSPEFPNSGRVPLVPPILEYLAALTHKVDPGWTVELVDANQGAVAADSLECDLVAVSVMTATAPWAYRFADNCRRRGLPVVLGGIHPTALPEEAAGHADAVVIGEAESVWQEVLGDAASGRLRRFYRGERLSLEGLPMPVDGRLKGNYRFRAFFTARGCPYRCTFCSVRKFFGDTIRYRPIPEVAAEIEARAGSIWFNGDDNIWGGDPERSIALFEALAQGKKRRWYGFGDLQAVQGPHGDRLLAAAKKSGLFSVWLGWESDSSSALDSFKAGGKQGRDRVAAIRKIQDAGIEVVLFVMVGGREEGFDSYRRAIRLADTLKVGIHPVLLTPLPGTELFAEYRPHLIPGLGWEAFAGVRAVFSHPDPELTPLRREEEFHLLTEEIYRMKRVLGRVFALGAKSTAGAAFLSLMMQLPMKVAYHKAYSQWRRDFGGTEVAQAGAGRPGRLDIAARVIWLVTFLGLVGLHIAHGSDEALQDRLEMFEMTLYGALILCGPVFLASSLVKRGRSALAGPGSAAPDWARELLDLAGSAASGVAGFLFAFH